MTLNEPRVERSSEAADLEAAVDTLVFQPVLHFQAQLGENTGYVIESHSRAALYMSHGEPLVAKHACSGWSGVLNSGELLFLPRGGKHEVATDELASLVPIAGMANAARGNGRHTFQIAQPNPTSTLTGSFFWTKDLQAHPLIARLPAVVHLRADRCGSQRWLEPMGRLMRWMTDLHGGGSGVGMNESANALLRHVVLALLKHAGQPVDEGDPLQAARRDAALAPALRAVHMHPENDWSVERLAALCHMSRTTFASRFNLATGETPLRYLTRWRMLKARQLMATRQLSLDQVAEHVGYSSGFAFSKAYKRETSTSPRGKSLRRNA